MNISGPAAVAKPEMLFYAPGDLTVTAFELTELFASGELTAQDMDGIMYEMHKAYFKYREQEREKNRILNL